MSVRKTVEARIEQLNKRLGWADGKSWETGADGKWAARPGAFELEYTQPGDSKHCYRIERISSAGGAVSCITNARMNGAEALACLDGLLYGLEIGREMYFADLPGNLSAPDIATAAAACVDDLKRYASTHGPGPDRRLVNLLAALGLPTPADCERCARPVDGEPGQWVLCADCRKRAR